MRCTRLLVSGCLLVSVGCARWNADVSAPMSLGTAWGRDAAEAERAACLVDEALASTLRLLPGATLRPFDMSVVEADRFAHSESGMSSGMVGRLDGDRMIMLLVGLEGAEARSVAVHEAVHTCVDPVWDSAPQALEEGLGDYVGWLDGRARGTTEAPAWARVVLARQPEGISTSVSLGGTYQLALGSAGQPGFALDDPAALLSAPDDVLSSGTDLGVSARAVGFLVVHRIASREGLVGLRALLEANQGRELEEVARLLTARAGLSDFCDLVEAAHELTDPAAAEARARAFASRLGIGALLDGAGSDPQLLILVDGRHPVAAEPGWFLH